MGCPTRNEDPCPLRGFHGVPCDFDQKGSFYNPETLIELGMLMFWWSHLRWDHFKPGIYHPIGRLACRFPHLVPGLRKKRSLSLLECLNNRMNSILCHLVSPFASCMEASA